MTRDHQGLAYTADAGFDEARRSHVRQARQQRRKPTPGREAKKDDVVDADFKEVDDDKGDKKKSA
jgi:hypothetical protein